MSDSRKSVATWVIVLSSILLLALAVFVIVAHKTSWWAFSSITYLPAWLKWGLVTLAAVGFLVGAAGLFAKLSDLKSLRRYRWLLLLVLAIGLFLLRETVPLLGDGWLLIGLTEKCASLFPVWTSDRPEPLGLLFFTGARVLTGVTSQTLYQVISVLSAVAILLLLAWFGRRSKLSLEHGWLLGIPLFTSASLVLFSGYIESYPLLMVMWTATLLYAVGSTQDCTLPFWPLLVAIPFLFFWHYLSLILLPVIAFSGFLRLRESQLMTQSFLLSLAGFFALLFLVYLLTPLRIGVKWMLPLSPAHAFDGYSLFSSHHIVDSVWEMVLAAPLALFLIFGAWRLRPELGRDAGFQILAFAALLGFAAAFVFDPELGMARDWDLLAAMLLPLNIWAGYAMAKARPSAQIRNRIAGAALVSLFVIAMPFIIVNHQPHLSVERFETLLSLHPQRSAYGWEILSETVGQNDPEASLTYLENAAKVSSNQRYLQNIAATALQLGHRDRAYPAVVKLRGATPRNFPEANAYFFFFLEFGFVRDAERMLPYLEKFAPPGEDLNSYREVLTQAKKNLPKTEATK
jgi:hypothetical protein